jgi:co-chaperonin GroES (HSP10)
LKPIPSHISADQIEAAFDKIIIKREIPEATKGGVLLPDSAKMYMSDNVGRIVSMGPSADRDQLDIGQLVYFGKHAGDWVKLPGSEDSVYICLDVDVMAVIKESE